MPEPWEQQENESNTAYAAFAVFRDLMPPRQVTTAFRVWRNDPKARTSGTWQLWQKQYQWDARAVAYDHHVDKVRLNVTDRVVAEVQEKRVRLIEASALNTIKAAATLAHSDIADVISWGPDGVRVKDSSELPEHVTAAIQKVTVTHDRNGNPNVSVEMHPKVTPIDLLGRHFRLWEEEKKQAQTAQTNAFLEFLNFVKSGAIDSMEKPWSGEASLLNPPPGVIIDGEVVK